MECYQCYMCTCICFVTVNTHEKLKREKFSCHLVFMVTISYHPWIWRWEEYVYVRLHTVVLANHLASIKHLFVHPNDPPSSNKKYELLICSVHPRMHTTRNTVTRISHGIPNGVDCWRLPTSSGLWETSTLL